MILAVLLFAYSCSGTALNQDSINILNSIYPRCFVQDGKTVLYLEEEQALFATRMRVFLAPKGRCSFLATGSVKLEWDAPENPKDPPPIWNYALNYTGVPCSLYGGDTLEEAMRNASNGLWLKGGHKNCAYYVVVGNNLKNN